MINRMDKPKYIFGVDLDGVCADFYGGIRKFAAEWLGKDESELTPEVSYGLDEWGIPSAPGGYENFHRFIVTQRDLFSVLEPIKDCPQVLRRLSQEGVHIRIITHRLVVKYFHKQAISQTIDWLDHHGIPYWDLCFLQQKAHVGANIYIDDGERNVIELRNAGQKVIIFTNSTNRHLEGLRADTWLEVEEIVMKDYAEWKEQHASA